MRVFTWIIDILAAVHECFWMLYLAKKLLNVKIETGKFGKLIVGLTFVGYTVLNLVLQTSPYVIFAACLFMIGVLWWFGNGKLFVTSAIVVLYHMILAAMTAVLVVLFGLYCSEHQIIFVSQEVDGNYIVFRMIQIVLWLLINVGVHLGFKCRELKYKKIYLSILSFIGVIAVIYFLRDYVEISIPWLIHYIGMMEQITRDYYFVDTFLAYGTLFLFLNIGYGIYAIFTYKKVWQERELVVERNKLLEDKYTQLDNYYTSNAKLYHDMSSHLQTIRYMAQKQDVANIVEYVDGIERGIRKGVVSAWTGIGVVDAILSEFERRAKEQGIDFEINAELILGNLSVENWELCSIFSNLLNNCMEANPTKVRISVKMVGQMFFVRTQNDYVGERKVVNGRYESSKENGKHHGWGLRNIEEITQKYGGNVEIQEFKGMFCVDVMLNIH